MQLISYNTIFSESLTFSSRYSPARVKPITFFSRYHVAARKWTFAKHTNVHGTFLIVVLWPLALAFAPLAFFQALKQFAFSLRVVFSARVTYQSLPG